MVIAINGKQQRCRDQGFAERRAEEDFQLLLPFDTLPSLPFLEFGEKSQDEIEE